MKGAVQVRVLVLPQLLSGKTGVDDYVAETGATVEDLAKLVKNDLPEPPKAEHDRPVIVTNGRHVREVTQEALEAVGKANERGDSPRFFTRGTELSRLRTGEQGVTAEALDERSLPGVLDRAADFVTITEREGEKPSKPPFDVVRDILHLPDLGIPPLRGIAEVPTFVLGGDLLGANGYHPGSGLYLSLNGLQEGLRTDMTPEQATLFIFGELLYDFPFTNEAARAHTLALLLQAFVRPLISGPTPLYLIDAPAKGTGKGLLADVVAIVATGRPAYVESLVRDSDEVEKRITATLLAGFPMILLDNVSRLSGDKLSAVLTTTLWRGRRLGKSEMVQVPNLSTWLATGNNVTLASEIVRRTVTIRLDARVERSEERTGWRHSPLTSWAETNRPALVSACLSLVRSWRDAGMKRRILCWAALRHGVR